MTIFDVVAKHDKKLKKLERAVCCIQEDIGGQGFRFAVAGQDDTAGEDRIFDTTGFNFSLVGVTQDDTATMLMALDGSNNIKWVDKTTIVATLQAVTDAGNTTDNQIVSTFYDNYALTIEREGVFFGVGFTPEAGGTGWGGTYLGGSLEYTAPGTTDKANVYIGLAAGQARTQGGEFNIHLGYQAGLAHPGTNYKFYLAGGSTNHLLYGEFDSGNLWLKRALKIGDIYDGLGPTIPAAPGARLDIVAGTTTLAPIKLNAGVNLTVPVDGTFEFDGIDLFFTTGGVRKTVTLV